MNWDDARVFLALCREQTLRAAARALAVDQATVGRRLASLERALGATLFLRTSGGYALTPAGEVAMAAALAMESAASELQGRIQGMDDRLCGVVKLTTTESFAMEFVVPAIARLRLEHPGIEVQLHASRELLNLSRREADIAIRTLKPDNPDLIVRRVARWSSAIFASEDYVRARGIPQPGSAFAGHDLVLFQPYLDAGRELTLASEPITHGRIAVTCNSGMLVRRAVAAGLGIGEIPLELGERDGLCRLWPDRAHSPYDVWLVTHKDVRHSARVRVVIDAVVAAFEAAGG